MKPHVFVLVGLCLFACSNHTKKTPTKTVSCTIDLGRQPLKRVPVGSVVWLPETADGCGELDWAVSDLPAESGFLHAQEPRFVPLQPGTWTLQERTSGQSIEITAMATEDIPFHNLMYQPHHSMVLVDETLWVTEAFAPRIARFDAVSGAALTPIPVGPWPVSIGAVPSLDLVVVAQAGEDTIGLIDSVHNRLIDTIWVGDEPVGVVVDDAQGLAYVALETEDAVAVVDLHERIVTKRLMAPRSPRAMALTEDDQTLIVAGHRTGQPDRYPYAEDEPSDPDISALDVTTGEVAWQIAEAGNIITDLWIDHASSTVWVLAIVAFPERGRDTLDTTLLESQVQEYDLDTGQWLRTTTLGPGEDGAGFVLGAQDLMIDAGTVWVLAQDSEVLIGLDQDTMEEVTRLSVPGGPRSMVSTGDDLWVHSSQSYTIHLIAESTLVDSIAINNDPRPDSVRLGHGYFIRPGESYGKNFSCNGCHYDGRGDTQVWRGSTFEVWELSRPLMWLEGTGPLGWSGYVYDTGSFAYQGFTNIITVWPTTDMTQDLGAFLSSLAPPPKANGWTERDGRLSAEALAGKELYEGKAGCWACHDGSLSTNNETVEDGITGGRSSTPTLVGAYRHNAWLKDGSARTLREAIVAASEWSGVTDLSDTEIDSLERYLREFTDRDFFLLSRHPSTAHPKIGADEAISLTFNQAVWLGDENLARFQILDAAGQPLDISIQVDNRTVTLIPKTLLEPAATYQVVVEEGLASYDERITEEPIRFEVTTASPPSLWFEGSYVLTVQVPFFDFEGDVLYPGLTLAAPMDFVAEPTLSGSRIEVEYNEGLIWETSALIDGTSFRIPPLPIKVINVLTQSSAMSEEAIDLDGDGIVDEASGTFTIATPRFSVDGMGWEISADVTTGD